MKGVLRSTLNFFLSIRTAIYLLIAVVISLLLGSFVMPEREEYNSINNLPLFGWLMKNPMGATWWLWGAIAALSLLSANTLLCSIESAMKKKSGRQWLLIISPQIIHMGFLFILLAHLMSSIGSFKGTVVAYEGSSVMLPNGLSMKVGNINIELDPTGYVRDWRADIEYVSGGKSFKDDFLAPNRPSFYRGLGIYLKDVRAYPFKACLLEVSREPGALWALIGGVLFTIGTAALVILKMQKER